MSTADQTVFYPYEPNKVVAIVVASLYASLFIAHSWRSSRGKTWRLMWPFNLGVLVECAGYALRRVSADHIAGREEGLKWFLSQNLCIILAPAMLAASMYMLFGGLILLFDDHRTPIRASRVTLLFVTFDVVSLAIQGVGGVLFSAENPNVVKLAKLVLTCGFIVQMCGLGLFLLFAGIWHARMRSGGCGGQRWEWLLSTLYLGALLIFARSAFRIVEFNQDADAPLQRREIYTYLLEALPVFLVVILFVILRPGWLLPTRPMVGNAPDVDLAPCQLPDFEDPLDPFGPRRVHRMKISLPLQSKEDWNGLGGRW